MKNEPSTATSASRVSITPYLICKEAAQLIEFYKQAFGAQEDYRLMQDDGRVGHAELTIGGARFSIADEFPEMGFKSPASYGGSPVLLHLYVDDVDAFFDRARAAKAQVLAEPSDEFHGDRVGRLVDPSGHLWLVATRKAEMSPEEMQRRMSTR